LDSDEERERKQIIDQVMRDIGFDSTTHKQNLSFREFCRQSGYIKGDDDKSYIWSNKTIRIDERGLSAGSKAYFEQAGVKKQLKLGEKPKDTKDEKKERKTVDFCLNEDIDVILDYLQKETEEEFHYKEEDFLLNKENIGMDLPEANFFKKLSIDCYEEPYKNLKKQTVTIILEIYIIVINN